VKVEKPQVLLTGCGLLLLALLASACASPAPTVQPGASKTAGVRVTREEAGTPASPGTPIPTATVIVEQRRVDLEWPARMRLGESDVVRLALIPSSSDFDLSAEFPEHQVQSQIVHVPRPGGYDLFVAARLDGVGFAISPAGDQEQYLPPDETLAWRWSISPRDSGQQRLSIALTLRWLPVDIAGSPTRQFVVYSKGFTVHVVSIMGFTQSQVTAVGLVGLLFGGGLSLFSLLRARQETPTLRQAVPNTSLSLEPKPGLSISPPERLLLQSLFRSYSRLVLESEFLSGYSGARTFLAQPIREDGRSDAYTIVKIGRQGMIAREFENYETFVKNTLPPVTARIQQTPVFLPASFGGSPASGRAKAQGALAGLQYTFIGTPGSMPASLRSTLLADPDPGLLEQLFKTFGPNWRMQRRAYTFRLAQEYDRMLPAHLVLEPLQEHGGISARHAIHANTSPSNLDVQPGEIVVIESYTSSDLRLDGKSQALQCRPQPGQPALRLRWMSLEPAAGRAGQILATRNSLLQGWVSGFERYDLPDPLARLQNFLDEPVMGTQSTIHGDLNLENILVGPGRSVWLIDFAQTREGHPLFDFAHLEAEIIAHIAASHLGSPLEYLDVLHNGINSKHPAVYGLLDGLERIASHCLFDPTQPREYHLALCAACLGALKFANLGDLSRHLLYLTAANLVTALD
jgi:hypothetical protein